jgi:hypothetical protein
MSRQFTVIGFWDKHDRRHVVGVIEGEHDVTSGVDVTEGGLFAEFVEDAIDPDSACSMIHGTAEEHEFEADGSELCEVCDLTLEDHDA